MERREPTALEESGALVRVFQDMERTVTTAHGSVTLPTKAAGALLFQMSGKWGRLRTGSGSRS